MSKHGLLVLFALPLAAATAGCSPSAWMGVDAFVVGYEAGRASMQAPSPEPSDDEDVPLGVELVPAGPSQAVNLQPPAPGAPSAPPFDVGRAYDAIASADLSPCKSDGLSRGYGRAILAFAPDGTVTGVSFDLPPSSSRGARSCVDAVLRETRIPAFAGDQVVKVRRAFYVT